MKKILLVVLFLLLFPSIVLAKDTCNNGDIKIEEINVEEKEGYPEELIPVSIDNKKINLNIEMYNVGESITYKIKVKNNSNNDYYFTKDSFNLNTDYLEYSLLNDSEVIKANEEKSIQLRITYKEKISKDDFNEKNMMAITLSDTPLSNPSTKRSYVLILLVIFITISLLFTNKNNQLNKVLIGILICSIPLSIKALCTVNLEINANITINEKEAIFLPGTEVNVKMKELAGDDTSASDQPYNFLNENITAIKYSNQEPAESEKEEKNIVSTSDSSTPIYMWYEEGIIYWWSEAHHLKLNENASYMFAFIKNLTNILDLEKIDASCTTNIESILCNDTSLNDLSGLKEWNTENITNLNSTFYGLSITSLEALRNWDVSNVKSMRNTFLNTSLENLNGLENWNVSKVESMDNTFWFSRNLSNIEALSNWDTSKVTSMSGMFTSTNLTNLNALAKWDVSNVTSFYQMFRRITNLNDVNAINSWNIQKDATFTYMFWQTPSHPEFTKFLGTWDSRGTFIPTP